MIAERAGDTDRVVDEATAAGLAADHPLVVEVTMLRLELLKPEG